MIIKFLSKFAMVFITTFSNIYASSDNSKPVSCNTSINENNGSQSSDLENISAIEKNSNDSSVNDSDILTLVNTFVASGNDDSLNNNTLLNNGFIQSYSGSPLNPQIQDASNYSNQNSQFDSNVSHELKLSFSPGYTYEQVIGVLPNLCDLEPKPN